MRTSLLWPFLLAACPSGGGDDSADTDLVVTDSGTPLDTDTTDDGGLCGDISYFDLTLIGKVNGPTGAAAAGALVHVEERAWKPQPEVFGGTETTDATGRFELFLPQVRSVEDCWGIVVDYVVVATQAGSTAEDDINQPLFTAINNGTFVADISAFPLQLSAP